MKEPHTIAHSLAAILLVLCIGLAGCGRSQQAGSNPSSTQAAAPPANQAQSPDKPQGDIAKQQKDAEQQARPDIEKQRKEAQQEAQKTLDADAVAAIAETQAAVNAIADNKRRDAIAAIERATGKINILLARKQAAALLPVAIEVDVIDAAPLDVNTIKIITRGVDSAVDAKDYPTARLLLHSLTSEIRVRTYNLPLATYPEALKEAARLLDQQKSEEAGKLLLVTLNTLAVIDRVDPLPVILAQKAIDEAENVRDKDKDAALKLLSVSRNELERAKELGYAGKDPEYAALNKSISDLEKQLKGGADTQQAFSKLKEKVTAFFKLQSGTTRHT